MRNRKTKTSASTSRHIKVGTCSRKNVPVFIPKNRALLKLKKDYNRGYSIERRLSKDNNFNINLVNHCLRNISITLR